ncbi:MAG: hypothetical protein E6G91_20820 [Alphaproteobacteria bacterium]|nr:MAG: hypothetical protein E6G91_20820 [Alphaproteobacteria bacterium]
MIAIERNQSLPRLGALNDRVSSIKVGPQCLVVAFADEEYRGATTIFGPGEYSDTGGRLGQSDLVSAL